MLIHNEVSRCQPASWRKKLFHTSSYIYRSSRPEVFCKKGVLRNFTKFTGKRLCQNLFFSKATGLKPATLLKKRPWHWCFPVNFTKFLRKPFYLEHLWWLLLHIFCLHFLRIHHDYFFQRVFESVRAQFLSGNLSWLLVIYLFNYNSSKSTPCWTCNWTFSWVQFLSNKLKIIRFLRCKITRISFFLLMLCVLISVIFSCSVYFFIKT